MIYKLNKENCYRISGKLILNNRYTKIEGDVYDSGYIQNTLKTDKGTLLNETLGDENIDPRKFTQSSGSIGLIYYVKFGYKFYYKTYSIGQLTSTEVMDKNINSFVTKITPTGDSVATKTADFGVGMPPIAITYPAQPLVGGMSYSTYLNHAKRWLGNCVVYYEDITSFSVTPTISVINKIEVYTSRSTNINGEPPTTLAGTISINDEVTYEVLSTNFFQESSDFSYGENNSLLTYKLKDNELFNVGATQNNVSLISKVSDTLLKNYKRGKQVVKIECPNTNIIDTEKNIYNNFIFEPGQYFYIEDENGNSLFHYKLTNTAKIFEIISVEYIRETWNLVLKEVARNESN